MAVTRRAIDNQAHPGIRAIAETLVNERLEQVQAFGHDIRDLRDLAGSDRTAVHLDAEARTIAEMLEPDPVKVPPAASGHRFDHVVRPEGVLDHELAVRRRRLACSSHGENK